MGLYRNLQGRADELVVRAVRELQDQVYSLKGKQIEHEAAIEKVKDQPKPEPAPTLVQQGLNLQLSHGFTLSSGKGTPEGIVVGAIGDFYIDSDGSSSKVLWVKVSSSNERTGWTAVI